MSTAATNDRRSDVRAHQQAGRPRQATLEEIHAAARKLLVEQGPAAVTINAVARRVGMSGPPSTPTTPATTSWSAR
jgi:hypothetical protein